jgi:adenylyl- and sulfurtransferase ThiI
MVLLSGGIDSPVCVYQLIKDGWDVACLHMDNRPFTDDTYDLKKLFRTDKPMSRTAQHR